MIVAVINDRMHIEIGRNFIAILSKNGGKQIGLEAVFIKTPYRIDAAKSIQLIYDILFAIQVKILSFYIEIVLVIKENSMA